VGEAVAVLLRLLQVFAAYSLLSKRFAVYLNILSSVFMPAAAHAGQPRQSTQVVSAASVARASLGPGAAEVGPMQPRLQCSDMQQAQQGCTSKHDKLGGENQWATEASKFHRLA
jgi:hypothetical protein